MRQPLSRFDYQPCEFEIERVHLTFKLSLEKTEVRNTMLVRRLSASSSPLILEGRYLTLKGLYCNDHPLKESEYTLTETQLIIPHLPNPASLIIETEINPLANTRLEGLYASNGIFCTQCEAQGFSTITYFLDRPDVMTYFTTDIIGDAKTCPQLLSNGNLIQTEILAKGLHRARWVDPIKKSAYLFALVAGRLDCLKDEFITSSGRTITLKIYTEEGLTHRCHHAMASLKLAMRWDEIHFGREYDLDIFMIVAVSDFNMGAMENKGLNIFNAKYILADPRTATDQDYENILAVVGHEYFHNWSGNRITCRDWFQLSLKEGLTVFREQAFQATYSDAGISRIDDVIRLRTFQFTEDAGPLAHPVRPDSYLEVNNLYTTTVYEKGAELIHMFRNWLGPERFRAGMDYYFTTFDGQAVTCDDFLLALSEGSGQSLLAFQSWYSQAGTPHVRVKETYDPQQAIYTLTLEQYTPPTPYQQEKSPLPIPLDLALFSTQGESFILKDGQKEETLLLDTEKLTVSIENINTPPILSILRHFSAPVIIEKINRPENALILLAHETDSFARFEASQTLFYHTFDDFLTSLRLQSPFPSHEAYLTALGQLLDHPLEDSGLKARILARPALAEISERYPSPLNLDQIILAYETWTDILTEGLYSQAEQAYHQLVDHRPYCFSPEAVGKRQLKNLCLYYLLRSGNPEAIALALNQYHQSDNMSDKLAALQAILLTTDPASNILLKHFYAEFEEDELVLDKWFYLQATRPGIEALDRVKKLLEHPQFSYTKPNKVRALIGGFSQHNFAHFHDLDGSGYFFLGEQIHIIDKINPQIAARLVQPFSQWKRLDGRRQELIQTVLETLMTNSSLSDNVYEMIAKSLSA